MRGVHYAEQLDVLATVGEDSQVKLWDINSINKRYEEQNGFIEPFMTLRGHTGPINSITGPKIQGEANSDVNQAISRLIYTAGNDGCIRVWNIP